MRHYVGSLVLFVSLGQFLCWCTTPAYAGLTARLSSAGDTFRESGLAASAQQTATPVSASVPSAAIEPKALSFEISGVIKSGALPLPGVTVTASHSLTGKRVYTSTDIDGSYKLAVPSKGKYIVRVELTAFATQTSEIVVNPTTPAQKADFTLVLMSRAPKTEEGGSTSSAQQIANLMAQRGTQRLSVNGDDGAQSSGRTSGGNGAETPLAGMPALASSAEATNQSVAVSGQMGATQDFGMRSMEDMRDRIDELRAQGRLGEFGGGGGNFMGPMSGPMGGGPMGGGPMMIIAGGPGGGGRFNVNRPHGNLYYTAGNSIFDAAPYSLSGASNDKPDYNSGRFGGFVGGPLNVPHVYKGGTKTFFFAGYNGTRSSQPYDVFSHVPTAAERSGDFSQTVYTSGPYKGQPVRLYDPTTGAYLGSQLPASLISPAAQRLLSFIPLPNQPGEQNYRFTSTADNYSDNASFRLTHNFGAASAMPGMPGMGGDGGGRRGGGGRPRNSINFGGNYSRSQSDLLRAFSTVGGKTKSEGLNLNGGWSVGSRKLSSNLRVGWNAMRSQTSNRFSGITDVAGLAGITGVSTDPFDWGVPGLTFSNFRGLSDVTPSYRNDRTLSLGETFIMSRKKHTLRFGGDYRRMWTDLRSNTNPNGTFTFTGFRTATTGGVVRPGAGYDLADFLTGYAQQTTIQYSPYMFSFVANAWDGFIQDDWRMRSNLTVELGLRYEYNGPYKEESGRLVNLDITPGFTAVAPVQAGEAGPYSGFANSSIVKPDRNNFAPRIGIAWRTKEKMVVRAGYGINYNLGQYRSIVQNLAFQPPFSFTQTNLSSTTQTLTLTNGFPTAVGVTNNFAVDPNYRLGYVQMWNLNVQRELPANLVLNVGYTGSKGTALDIVRAPNRGPSGLRLADVQAFLYEDSLGSSILHSGSVRLRRRMKNGISVGGTYVYSKSIDNASSIGGGSTVVAQDDLNLAAERGLSSFDQRHRLTGDFLIELPFGSGKKWLTGQNFVSRVFGDWTVSGDFTVASGNPFTARVLGDISDVARGSNGSLRADYNGLPISVGDRSVLHWFNTAAFSAPATGTFGNAGRNTIVGPGTVLLNLAFGKNIPMKDMRGWEFRTELTNLLNHPNYGSIDTTVNSPTFGQVISVGSMRRVQLTTRYRF